MTTNKAMRIWHFMLWYMIPFGRLFVRRNLVCLDESGFEDGGIYALIYFCGIDNEEHRFIWFDFDWDSMATEITDNSPHKL